MDLAQAAHLLRRANAVARAAMGGGHHPFGALLVGLMANYTGYLAPKLALFSNIALMVAVLLWRPQGLYPVKS